MTTRIEYCEMLCECLSDEALIATFGVDSEGLRGDAWNYALECAYESYIADNEL